MLLRTTLPLLVVVLLLAPGCDRTRTYEVRGRVAGFGDDPTTLIVEHEQIPGLMPAMTMPFTAGDTAAVGSLSRGDALSFRLHVTDDSSWIDGIRKLPSDEVAQHPAGTPTATRRSGENPPLLEVGDEAPDIRFRSQADSTFRLSDLEGQPVLLTFIYTRCPLPDYCPLMSSNFSRLQSSMEDSNVHLLSVSFDPEYDTPEVLKEYGRRYTHDFSNWSFVTGDSADVKQFAERFGAFYEPMRGQIVHNLVTALIGRDGRIQAFWRGKEWSVEDVLREVRGIAVPAS